MSDYEGCCELDLYLASESICGCKHYIPKYKQDYKPPRATLILLQLPKGDYRDSAPRSFGNQPTSYLNETYLICYDAHDRVLTIEGNKEVTFEDKCMKEDVQVQENRQLSDIYQQV